MDQPSTTTTAFDIAFSPKPIACTLTSLDGMHDDGHNEKECAEPKRANPALIFTHGAGGDLHSDAILHFRRGFATQLPILCFQGNMNLKSRVKMFNAIVEAQPGSTNLGGRSMGARAAAMAVLDSTNHLVLVSYPLHTAKDLRDSILLALPPSIKVIFVSGDRDSMCDLERLQQVRRQMKCQTWRIRVQGADHGMKIKPRAGSADVVQKSGEVVAAWIRHSPGDKREGTISWEHETGAVWSGWCIEPSSATPNRDHDHSPSAGKTRKRVLPSAADQNDAEAVSSRTRKRRKV